MTTAVVQTLMEVETLGVELRLEGNKVVMRFPSVELRNELNGQLALLRSHKNAVSLFLREREAVPTMPPGVHLVSWELKEPPVAIETCAVVTDTALFAKTTLVQLRTALANPRRWVGWSIPQLMDRLAQVGVVVALESKRENTR
jgi:hypothetical protein